MRAVGALLAFGLLVACAQSSPPRLASPSTSSGFSTSSEATEEEPPTVEVIERAAQSTAEIERRLSALESEVATLRRAQGGPPTTSYEVRMRNLENAVASLRADIGESSYGSTSSIIGCLGAVLRAWGSERAPSCYL